MNVSINVRMLWKDLTRPHRFSLIAAHTEGALRELVGVDAILVKRTPETELLHKSLVEESMES